LTISFNFEHLVPMSRGTRLLCSAAMLTTCASSHEHENVHCKNDGKCFVRHFAHLLTRRKLTNIAWYCFKINWDTKEHSKYGRFHFDEQFYSVILSGLLELPRTAIRFLPLTDTQCVTDFDIVLESSPCLSCRNISGVENTEILFHL